MRNRDLKMGAMTGGIYIGIYQHYGRLKHIFSFSLVFKSS